MMQVKNDPKLLELMLQDSVSAPPVYKTTNYWSFKERELVPEIQKIGLKDFRRRRKSYLSSFGATDLPISLGEIDLYKSSIWNSNFLRRIPLWSHVLSSLNTILNKISPTFLPTHTEVTVLELQKLAYEFAHLYGVQHGAKSLSDYREPMIGNPDGVFSMEGRDYTVGDLYYYMRYAYLCTYIDFNSVKVIVELGSGLGKQVEVLKKFYPDICFVLFDIPPQLYVCEQYLKTVFHDSIVPYEQTRTMDSIAIEKGKIFIMGNWKFPLVDKMAVDLFWNAASFQEMEPDVVANYLQYVNKSARNVYLQELMEGQIKAKGVGSKGVIQKTTLEDYQKGLSQFNMVNLSKCWTPLGISDQYSDSFWKLKNN